MAILHQTNYGRVVMAEEEEGGIDVVVEEKQ